jgi:uncharacterized Tic20 family protein
MYRIIESKDERTWGMLCHLSAFAGFVIPFGNIIGPLIVYSMKKEEFPFVADQGKESLNFQISVMIYFLISFILFFIAVGVLFIIVILFLSFILTVIATKR